MAQPSGAEPQKKAWLKEEEEKRKKKKKKEEKKREKPISYTQK